LIAEKEQEVIAAIDYSIFINSGGIFCTSHNILDESN